MKYRVYEIRLLDGEIYIALEDTATKRKNTLSSVFQRRKRNKVLKLKVLGYDRGPLFEPLDFHFGFFQNEVREYKRKSTEVFIDYLYVPIRSVYSIIEAGVKELEELYGNKNQ